MRQKNKHIKRLGIFLLFFLILLILLAMIAAVGAVYYVETTTEAHLDMSRYDFGESVSGSTIYYYNFTDRTNRIGEAKPLTTVSPSGADGGYISYEKLPPDLIQAFISIEDKSFWDHNGVNWRRSVAAMANHFLKYQSTFGASTITQQLIKNITGEDEQTPHRKLQEIRWALDLEQQMDKREIFELYVNMINLGQGCYGKCSAKGGC